MSPIHAILSIASVAADTQASTPMPPFRPFLDPFELHEWWFLLLAPMALLVAMIYKAVRLPTLEVYWRQVMLMLAQIVLGMIALGAATYVLVFWFARFVAERAA